MQRFTEIKCREVRTSYPVIRLAETLTGVENFRSLRRNSWKIISYREGVIKVTG